MPNRADTLDWEVSGEAAARRADLVDAAIALADEEGLDAVSIRRVAARIDLRPMSVYDRVASKEDLIALMFDRVATELLVPEPLPENGRELLRAVATRAHDAYVAHPWMLAALGRRPAPGPNQRARAEQSARAGEAFVGAEAAWKAASIVHEWTIGHAIHELTLREDPVAVPDGVARTDSFGEGLETVLDGLSARYCD